MPQAAQAPHISDGNNIFVHALAFAAYPALTFAFRRQHQGCSHYLTFNLYLDGSQVNALGTLNSHRFQVSLYSLWMFLHPHIWPL